ncbi:MAG: hypothetical protein ACFFCH_06840 [Promethearchaeota archaeon]
MNRYKTVLLGWRQHILEAIQEKQTQENLVTLLNQLIVYQSRVRKLSVPNLEPSNPDVFDGDSTPISLELAAEIDARLKRLASYRLGKAQRVIELLLAGLKIERPPLFNSHQINLISLLFQNPELGTVKLARKLHISPRTVNKQKSVLFSQFGIRTAAIFDPHQLDLTHLAVRFRTHSPQASQELEERVFHESASSGAFPFFQGVSFDVNQQDGFLSLYCPNRVKAKKQLDLFIEELNESFFEEFEHFTILGFYTNLNLDSYDYVSKSWQMISDLRTEGTRRFLEEHGPQFPPPRGFTYQIQRFEFDQADWLLLLSMCQGFLERKERKALLERYGFPLAEKTVWAHENRLRKAQILFPYLAFSPLFLTEIVCVPIRCERVTFDFLHQFSTQFVMSRLLPTKEGMILFIGVPMWASSVTNQLTHTLLDMPGLQDVKILRLKRDLPLIPSLCTYQLWNPATHRWKNAGR